MPARHALSLALAFCLPALASAGGVTVARDRVAGADTSGARIYAGPSGTVYWGSRVYRPGAEIPSEWRVLAAAPGASEFAVIDRYQHGKVDGNHVAWGLLESPRAGVIVSGVGTRVDGGQAWVVRRRAPGAPGFATVDDYLPAGAVYCNGTALLEIDDVILVGGFCLGPGFTAGRSILRASRDGGGTWSTLDVFGADEDPGRIVMNDLVRVGARGIAQIGEHVRGGRTRLLVRALRSPDGPAFTAYLGLGPDGENLDGYTGFTDRDGRLRVGAWVRVDGAARRVTVLRVDAIGEVARVSDLTDVSGVLRFARGRRGEIYGAFVDHRKQATPGAFVVKVTRDDGATWKELDRYVGERPGGFAGGNGVTVTRRGNVLASAVSFAPPGPGGAEGPSTAVVRRVGARR